ncbi:MAG: threonine/serine exporter family protein [Anaerolineales bacterium]|nr:threonine/serine exporter family protein [Anaerolineales bacterium]
MIEWIGFLALKAVIGAVAAAGFAVLFNLPKRGLWAAALAGALALVVQSASTRLFLAPEFGTFLGALAVGVAAQLLARRLRMPALLIATTGFIPLVPGVPAYSAVLSFAEHDYVAGTEFLARTIGLTIAIAAGLGFVNAVIKSRELQLF